MQGGGGAVLLDRDVVVHDGFLKFRMYRSVKRKKGRSEAARRRGERAQLGEAVGVDGADQLLALALGVDEAGVGELLDVVGHGRGAEVRARRGASRGSSRGSGPWRGRACSPRAGSGTAAAGSGSRARGTSARGGRRRPWARPISTNVIELCQGLVGRCARYLRTLRRSHGRARTRSAASGQGPRSRSCASARARDRRRRCTRSSNIVRLARRDERRRDADRLGGVGLGLVGHRLDRSGGRTPTTSGDPCAAPSGWSAATT